mmetsp:Transcript_14329/g.35986  ORF Transcript_14329/g.35986 Transcript_14329/m.35986 type:complete len:226 (+) Transcript_14329:140-817(+)|eukprot:CAMPEP_0116102808 /NCGR_PEP_ID=MMETSP0327-20121206/13550_1 /TAXON_ID=44447 /ORGANISM="Pseudo-nitzschia delicatissima, Strain B596" /LENGTH=225 /DNA_ID=CAMNT_0003594879 /DNA_START=58 /DNA_END=735 /DNA_ORIENTATION=-
MMFKSVSALVALLCVSGASAFAPVASPKASMTSLQMAKNEDNTKKVAASVLAATFILGNLATAAPAHAVDDFNFGDSSTVIAARSGGRAGGRSSGARMAPRPSRSSRPSPTVINRTYVTPGYSSPSVIMAPSYGYNPYGGVGLGLGLNAINQVGNDMRDYRQEREIQDTRSELNASRMREAEMEARLRQLESGQNGQLTQQQLMQQQMMFQQQQQAAAAAAAAAK